jgi:hypothetical protein
MARIPVGDLGAAAAARTPAQAVRLLDAEMQDVRAQFDDAELIADPEHGEDPQRCVDLAARWARLAQAWAAAVAAQFGMDA